MAELKYQECNLEKYECYECNKQFIVGTEMLGSEKPYCPYCKSESVDKIAWTDEERLEELDLGCLSLLQEVEQKIEE